MSLVFKQYWIRTKLKWNYLFIWNWLTSTYSILLGMKQNVTNSARGKFNNVPRFSPNVQIVLFPPVFVLGILDSALVLRAKLLCVLSNWPQETNKVWEIEWTRGDHNFWNWIERCLFSLAKAHLFEQTHGDWFARPGFTQSRAKAKVFVWKTCKNWIWHTCNHRALCTFFKTRHHSSYRPRKRNTIATCANILGMMMHCKQKQAFTFYQRHAAHPPTRNKAR